MAHPAAAAAPAPAGVAVVVICPAAEASALAEQLRDILGDVLGDLSGEAPSGERGAIAVAIAPRFEPAELFRSPAAGEDRPSAWVVIDGGTVHIRVAAAGRERFVFRDLAISQPLTELDRERIGQTAKVALTTVVEGGAGALARDAARAAAGVPPPSLATRAEQEEPAPETPPQPPDRFTFGLGAFLEIASIQSHFAYGPGIIATEEVAVDRFRPAVWMSLMAFLPHGIDPSSPAASYGSSFRAGVGLGVGARFRCDLGAGYDWVRPRYTGGGQDRVAAYRLGFRLGPVEIGEVKVTASALLEYTPQTFVYEEVSNGGDFRPGLAFELWWR